VTITGTFARTLTVTSVALTYAELAKRLGIAPDSAKRLALRKRWSKAKGNDGKTVIQVPAEFLDGHANSPGDDRPDSPRDRPADDRSDGHRDIPASVTVTEGALSEATTRLAVAQGELVEMARRLGSIEAKVQGLEALLAEVRAGRDAAQEHLRTTQEHLRTTQDQLRQTLAVLPKPAVRRSWWPWRRSA
jgi:hypothetical protein